MHEKTYFYASGLEIFVWEESAADSELASTDFWAEVEWSVLRPCLVTYHDGGGFTTAARVPNV